MISTLKFLSAFLTQVNEHVARQNGNYFNRLPKITESTEKQMGRCGQSVRACVRAPGCAHRKHPLEGCSVPTVTRHDVCHVVSLCTITGLNFSLFFTGLSLVALVIPVSIGIFVNHKWPSKAKIILKVGYIRLKHKQLRTNYGISGTTEAVHCYSWYQYLTS